jgi:O-Antigen ligase
MASDGRRPPDWPTVVAAAALASLPFESEHLAVPFAAVIVTLPEALLAAAIAVVAAAAWRGRARAPVVPDAALARAFAALVVVLVLSAVLAPAHRLNAVKFALRLTGGAAFGLAVCWLVRERAARAGVLLGALAGGVAVAAGVGLVDLRVAPGLDGVLALFRERPTYFADARRLGGTFVSPNLAATAVALALPTVVVAAVQKAGTRRALALVALAALVPALVLTYSRGGLMAAAVGLAALAGLAGRLGLRRLAVLAAGTIALIAACWVAVAQPRGHLPARLLDESEAWLLASRVEPPAAPLEAVAGASGGMPVRVTNVGTVSWRTTAEAPYTLTSFWYSPSGELLATPPLASALPAQVAPGESVVVVGRYRVPAGPGLVWLAWDVTIGDRVWLSRQGGRLGWVPTVVGRDAAEARRLGSRLGLDGFPAPPALARWINPSRAELWRAAWAMFRERPWLGRGPDSYRWEYGRYLGRPWWDRQVYANSLVLELLATTGALGLAAFGAVGGVVAWRGLATLLHPPDASAAREALAAALAALAVFVAHGAVDYFLEFTAGYAAPCALAGVVVGLAGRPGSGRSGGDTLSAGNG